MEQVTAAALFEQLGRLYVSRELMRAEIDRLRLELDVQRQVAATAKPLNGRPAEEVTLSAAE